MIVAPARDDQGRIARLIAVSRGVTERKRAEDLLAAQKNLLEMIATGRPLDECLAVLCAAVPRLNPPTRACVLLADDQRRKFARAITPGLGPSFGEALKDAPINELCIGTCGEALYSGEAITCEDIARDERWSKMWRDLCLSHGALAGHSTPIRNAHGAPLGSFMLCFDEARAPNERELRLAEFGVHVAGIALERDRTTEAALKEADRRKDEFLATLAHELRNPLAPIRTGLELLRLAGDDRALIEEVRSDGPNRGSEFAVRLPILAESLREPNPRDEEKEASAQQLRILVVDDNHDAARMLSLVLETLGNEVQTAHDGLEGVREAEQYLPDVVLVERGDRADRPDRLGPSRRPAALAGVGLRPPFGQAGRTRRAAQAAGRIAAPPGVNWKMRNAESGIPAALHVPHSTNHSRGFRAGRGVFFAGRGGLLPGFGLAGAPRGARADSAASKSNAKSLAAEVLGDAAVPAGAFFGLASISSEARASHARQPTAARAIRPNRKAMIFKKSAKSLS